jgi:phytoene synthase
VAGTREPVLAQLRLAWWRDRLAEPAENWPRGEPLLAALTCWQGRHGALAGLVDGWEALLGEAPLAAPALMQLVDGRAAAGRAGGRRRERPAHGARLGAG